MIINVKKKGIRPPPLLFPFFPLAAHANTLVSLHLQLMKATVLASYISSFHWALSAPAMSTDVSQVGVTFFPSF